MYYDQTSFDIRCEWGMKGVRYVGAFAEAIILVDVLSFSTCGDIAVSRGAAIYPCKWKDARASRYAAKVKAQLAGHRGAVDQFSFSPKSLVDVEEGMKIVLPSPNGSELSLQASSLRKAVFTSCFRNCGAVTNHVRERYRSIAVIPCGERWPGGSLRPAAEDWIAAGAIISAFDGSLSPEASAALAAYTSVQTTLTTVIESSVSGRELIERGFAEDVALACEFCISSAVPTLRDGAYDARDSRIG
ncbi:MAG: 2-phosphosulfolactate phosphatase [Planctomycetota bacterium]